MKQLHLIAIIGAAVAVGAIGATAFTPEPAEAQSSPRVQCLFDAADRYTNSSLGLLRILQDSEFTNALLTDIEVQLTQFTLQKVTGDLQIEIALCNTLP